ncbi:MAG: hypothetical protein GX291_02315 [Tissierellia bacterium]|jgi:hypothetical protein|nr:hypothetical protein [Bacillota bacterium]NLK58087.1 hypothetical protein [Tissierellia bacterium]
MDEEVIKSAPFTASAKLIAAIADVTSKAISSRKPKDRRKKGKASFSSFTSGITSRIFYRKQNGNYGSCN